MKSLILFLSLFVVLNSEAQNAFNFGIGGRYIQHGKMMGVGFSNDFVFKLEKGTIELGLDFVLGSGCVDLEKYNYLNIEYNGHIPVYDGSQWAMIDYEASHFPLKPKTSSSHQFILKTSYLLPFSIKKLDFNFRVGLFASYVNSSYLIGPVENTFFIINSDTFASTNIVYPVNQVYINVGAIFGLEYSIKLNKKLPLIMVLNYHFGSNQSSVVGLGVSYRIDLKKSSEVIPY